MDGSKQSIRVLESLRPAYYDDFHCIAAECRLSCCCGWHITFDKKDYLSLKRQSGSPDLNQRMESNLRRIRKGPFSEIHYGEFSMQGKKCPLLREDRLCALQAEKGHDALPYVCKSFPRTEQYTLAGYLEQSLSPACEAVLQLLWNLPDGIEFCADALPKEKRKQVEFDPQDSPLQPFFQEIRAQCIDLLQDRRFSLPQRIFMMGIALKELVEGKTDIPHWLAQVQTMLDMRQDALLPNTSESTNALKLFLVNNVRAIVQTETLGPDFDSIVEDIQQIFFPSADTDKMEAAITTKPYLEAKAKFEERFKAREYFMENLMVALFFHLHMPKLSSAEKLWRDYVNFCNLYSFYRFMAVMSCREGAAGNQADLFQLLIYASRSLIHNNDRQLHFRDEFFTNDSATLAHMAILLSG